MSRPQIEVEMLNATLVTAGVAAAVGVLVYLKILRWPWVLPGAALLLAGIGATSWLTMM